MGIRAPCAAARSLDAPAKASVEVATVDESIAEHAFRIGPVRAQRLADELGAVIAKVKAELNETEQTSK